MEQGGKYTIGGAVLEGKLPFPILQSVSAMARAVIGE